MDIWITIGDMFKALLAGVWDLLQIDSPFGFTYWHILAGLFIISLCFTILFMLLGIGGGGVGYRSKSGKAKVSKERSNDDL